MKKIMVLMIICMPVMLYGAEEIAAGLTELGEEAGIIETGAEAAGAAGAISAEALFETVSKAFQTAYKAVAEFEFKSIAGSLAKVVPESAKSTISYFSKQMVFDQIMDMKFQFAVMALLAGAYGDNVQWVADADAADFKKLSDEQKGIQTDFDNFVKDHNKKQTALTNKIAASFTASQKRIADTYGKSNEQFQQALVELNKSISLTLPKQQFLTDYVTMDQIFAHSVMLTPNQLQQQWYNLFQYGDWEYNADNNSFIQYQIVPFYSATEPNNPEYAQNNSIFTEYVSPSKSYNIAIECTLYHVTYPFFVGVIFNRARWISGDPERFRQYRLLGLYGTQSNDQKSIEVRFAENRIQGTGQNIQILSPIKQIVSSDNRPFGRLSNDTVTALDQNAIKLRFEITTAPTTIKAKVVVINGTEKAITFGVDNLNPLLFLYGGIGFVASGCRAEFKVIQPATVRYNSHMIQTYKNDLLKLQKGRGQS